MTNYLRTVSPVDGSVYVERPFDNDAEIQSVIEKANESFGSWRRMTIRERAEICSYAVDFFASKRDRLAEEITWQMGRPIKYSPGEIDGFVERARYMIKIAEHSLAPVVPEAIAGFQRTINREPLGVMFVIAPWNYPYLTSVNAVVPALMAGNSVILKHATQTPLCAERFVEAFAEAGVPEGVFQYLHLTHDDVATLIKSADINGVAFTGSVAGGIAVETAAAGRFLDVGLELGGKDPAYVRHDADIRYAVETTMDGAFFNSGQSCCGIERLYVHQSVFDDFLAAAVEFVNTYRLGRPDEMETTLGPLVRTEAASYVQSVIEEAISAGANAHIDAKQFPMHNPDTPYLAPQILTNVDHSMRIMSEETFGPVIGIMSVKDDDEAINLMNDSEFGLTASVFTQDNEAAETIGQQVETGTFFQNRCDYLDPALAWTGIRNSGRGCTLSSIGYEHVTRPKSFHLKQIIR